MTRSWHNFKVCHKANWYSGRPALLVCRMGWSENYREKKNFIKKFNRKACSEIWQKFDKKEISQMKQQNILICQFSRVSGIESSIAGDYLCNIRCMTHKDRYSDVVLTNCGLLMSVMACARCAKQSRMLSPVKALVSQKPVWKSLCTTWNRAATQ